MLILNHSHPKRCNKAATPCIKRQFGLLKCMKNSYNLRLIGKQVLPCGALLNVIGKWRPNLNWPGSTSVSLLLETA